MAKRSHAKKRKAKSNPSRKRSHARKRTANPKRSHARKRTHRAKASNPKRSHARRPMRARKANPARRRRHARRNPGIPAWAMAGLAAGLGLVTYAVGTDGAFALTQRTDETLKTLERNRMILGGVLTVGGLALAAFASPVLGAGVAAGGLAALAGTQASLALGHVLDKTNADGSLQTAKLSGVFAGGRQRLGAVFNDRGRQQLGAVFDGGAQVMTGMGNFYDESFPG